MKTASVLTALVCVPALAQAWSLPQGWSFHRRAEEQKWSPPGPGDVRAPCPMLNTLANHGFLPHDGKNITVEKTQAALFDALHIGQNLSAYLHSFAVTTNPMPNATTFDLDMLSRHNILEHDASLSRADFYWGDNHSFNQTVFNETRSYWTGPVLDLQMAATARLARIATSNKTNPTYVMSDLGANFGVGESAAYLMLLGPNKTAGTAQRDVVEYLFENEKLPFALGWKKVDEVVSTDDLYNMMDRVQNATPGATTEGAAQMMKRGGIHFPPLLS